MSSSQEIGGEERVKEIVVLSGKGGTGKTTVAGGMCWLSPNALFCDSDVDAANLQLVLGGEVIERRAIAESKKARIDSSRCVKCGLCVRHCMFEAIRDFRVDPFACEGCGVCARICRLGAVQMTTELTGHLYVSGTPKGRLVHARLEPGEENTGKLVSLVRKEAHRLAKEEGKNLVINDGPPGIGCPAISTMVGADLALIVTEPTLAAMHDLERILKVCDNFRVPARVCINRYDVHPENSDKIQSLCEALGAPVICKIPFDRKVMETCVNGIPVTSVDSPAARAVAHLTETLLSEVSGD